MTTPDPTSLYRYYDEHGLLLYVGITGRGSARNVEHNKSKTWWKYVVRQAVDHYETRAAAEQAEKIIIQSFRPPFNTQHNHDWRALRRAYEELACSGELKVAASKHFLPKMPRKIPLTLCNRLMSESGKFLVEVYEPGPGFEPIRPFFVVPTGNNVSNRITVANGGKKQRAYLDPGPKGFVVSIRSASLIDSHGASMHLKVVAQKPLIVQAGTVEVSRSDVRVAS